MSSILNYAKRLGPKAYPSTHKRCRTCGEIILWNDDCSYGHFKQMGQEIRRKAHDMWGPKQTLTRRKQCKPDSGPSSSEQHSLLD